MNGVAVTVANPLLYRGLARGPISIVAPIVASHPALVVALSVVMGSRPDAVHTKDQWGAMVVTLAGASSSPVARGGSKGPGSPPGATFVSR